MADYNTNFELTVDDVELIEMALRKTKALMSRPDLEASLGETEVQDRDAALHQIQDLLGRMHNQKVFFRPKDDVYIGG